MKYVSGLIWVLSTILCTMHAAYLDDCLCVLFMERTPLIYNDDDKMDG